jgi:hypothetical protein
MLNEIKRVGIVAAACVAGVLSSVAPAQNVLQNAGFETRCPLTYGWDTFGNVFVDGSFATSGRKTFKLFGPFCCPTGYSGFVQDVPTAPGQQWSASCMATSPAYDALRWNTTTNAGSRFFLEMQFLDANKNIVHDYQSFISPKLSNSTNSLPVSVSTPVYTAPAGSVYCRLVGIVEQSGYVGGAVFVDDLSLSHPGGSNVLVNGTLEDSAPGCLGSNLKYWINFGNGGPNNDGNSRTGGTSAKLWGGYAAPVSYSGWFQDIAAAPGTAWQLSGWGRTIAGGDHIAPGNDVFLSVEFIDAFDGNISGYETFGSPWRSPAMPTGGANNNTYAFYQSGVAVAPEGTVKVRALIYQKQAGYAGGATWWDDMELNQVSTTTCYADYNQDGGVDGADIEAFFTDWSAGSSNADVNQDGGVDGGDIEGFFLQWQAGGC